MYPSKILLFGEYTILLNSYALTIPFNRFKGELAFMEGERDPDIIEANNSNQSLKEFLTHVKLVRKDQNFHYPLEIDSFEKDLENGLYFKSDIPKGCGLGSSGGLVAAIFSKYAEIPTEDIDFLKLRNNLALLESFYHGLSSGIDPLVSYLKTPLLIKNNEIFRTFIPPVEDLLRDSGLFLVNSQHNGKTSNRVNSFNNKYKSDSDYFNALHKEYIPVNNECVITLTTNNTQNFFPVIQKLTRLQLYLFKDMIPGNLVPLINFGLENNLFYLKLCGSGGGYFLGFTENSAKTIDYFKGKGLQTLFY